jgi:hypothetical protein
MRLLSKYEVSYYQADLIKILQVCEPGKEEITAHFYKCGFCFLGDKGVLLRRSLHTLTERGYMICRKSSFNYLYWSITEKGIAYVASYDKTNPLPHK